MNEFLVGYLDAIDERLLEYFDQDDGVHGPLASLARRPGVVHLLSISTRVGRPLNVRSKWRAARVATGTTLTGVSMPHPWLPKRLRLGHLTPRRGGP